MQNDNKALQRKYELFFNVAKYVPSALGDRAFRSKMALSDQAGEILNVARAVVALSEWAEITTDLVEDCTAFIALVRVSNHEVFAASQLVAQKDLF